MYRIAICDDDIAYTEYLEKKIKEVLGKSERSSICKYYSGGRVYRWFGVGICLVF